MKKTAILLLAAIVGAMSIPLRADASSSIAYVGDDAATLAFKSYAVEAAGLQWCFYSNGTAILYKSRAGLEGTWSNATYLRDGWIESLAVCNYGDYIIYTFNGTTYREGLAAADGSIAWLGGESATGFPNPAQYSDIAVDSAGYSWIGYYTSMQWHVARNSNHLNGNWTTELNYNVASCSQCAVFGNLIALADRDMAWIGATNNGATLRGANYVSATDTWSSLSYGASNVKNDYNGWPLYSACYYDTGRVMVCYETTGNLIQSTLYDSLTNTFSGGLVVASGVADNSCPQLSYTSLGRVVVFWAHSPDLNGIYYREMDPGTFGWNARVQLLGNETLAGGGPYCLFYYSAPLYCAEDTVGLYYCTDSNELRYVGVYGTSGTAVSFIVTGATNITPTAARLNAYCVYDGGGPCTAAFYYGSAGAEGEADYSGNITSGMSFSVDVSGLVPSTTYGYWCVLTRSGVAHWSTVSEFITAATSETTVPTAVTDLATDITDTAFVMHGRVEYDGNLPCFVGFQWRLYGETEWHTGWNSITLATQHYLCWRTGDTFSASLSNLQQHTAYEFRAIVKNGLAPDGVYGEVKTVTTGYGIYEQPTPTVGGGDGGAGGGPIHWPWGGLISTNVRLILALVVTIGGMLAIGIVMGQHGGGNTSGVVILAYGLACVVGFSVYGFYPFYVLYLVGGIVALGLLLTLAGRGGSKAQ